MKNKSYVIESSKPFSESLIWQLNRDFYQKEGLEAWRSETVPHHLSSNASIGKAYAELIFGFLRDLSTKGQTSEVVYILELGAAHGRLAYHILKHLDRLIAAVSLNLPPYCYILSDIATDNLDFFHNHPQFQFYFENGLLDLAYFDAMSSADIQLIHSGKTISTQSLNQPLLAIANYFFDSIPTDLFVLKNEHISTCSVSLHSDEDPTAMSGTDVLKNIQTKFQYAAQTTPFYKEVILNEMMDEYRLQLLNAYLFFPHKGISCIKHLRQLSKKGLMLISMDKGYHHITDLQNTGKPQLILHGSFSIWVNYHALCTFCKKSGGIALFPSFPTFFLDLGCLFFLPEGKTYSETRLAYQRFVNDTSPDDLNGLKRFTYKHIAHMTLKELVKMLRMSAFDSSMFIKVLPRIKQLIHQVTVKERNTLAQLMHETWDTYFTINEAYDLAYEMGGIFYDLGFYKDALSYFNRSVVFSGEKADVFYNQALCYYQLREDKLFVKTLTNAKIVFPDYERFAQLEKLDLGAE